MSVRFTQSCPTCGRRVQIRASLMGYTVACQHCRAEFVAEAEAESDSRAKVAPVEPADPLMLRVEQALERASKEPTAFT